MPLLSRQFGLANPAPIPDTASALSTAPYTALPAAPIGQDGFPRPFGDAGFTSRCPEPLPAGAFAEAWTVRLDDRMTPAFVSAARDRILTQGGGFWRLLDAAGKPIAAEPAGAGPAFLDGARDLLIYLDRNDYIVAARQRDGKFAFRVPVPFGDLYAKPLVASAGDSFVIVAVEQEGLPHRHDPANQSAIQVIGTGRPLTFFQDGTLASLDRDEKILIRSVGLLGALNNGHLTAVWPERLLITGLDLKIRALIRGRFDPGLLALDEAGRSYIILADDRGDRALWVLSPSGQRMLALVLSLDLGTLFFPPIVGYDHRVFILTRYRLLALAPDGSRLWTGAAQSSFNGATVTASGHVIAADGREVVSFSPTGTRRVLAQVPGVILAPPVLGVNQMLLVARAGYLHAFRSS